MSTRTDKNTKPNSAKDIPWLFLLDHPKIDRQRKKSVSVKGWFTPTDRKSAVLRLISPDNGTQEIIYGKKRADVLRTLQADGFSVTSDAIGFECDFVMTSDGPYRIEAKIGKGDWEPIHTFQLKYEPEESYKDLYNANLGDLYAKHEILLASKQTYFHEPGNRVQFNLEKDDPKLVAFYLPQFHTFKENDEWWGKGFTEWSGVTADRPRFVGHEQPKLPADFGFYDLKNEEVMRDQVELAKKHGIFGFCFYYYWFSGKRLLERPIESFLRHKEWDFNFMICWANENWTRRWDGRNQDILIAQKRAPDDPLKFIKDVSPILTDPRYIHVDGKPVLLVYRPKDLKDPNGYAKIWREYFKKNHGSDLHLVSVQGFDFEEPKTLGFDKGLSFVPHSLVKQLNMKILPQYPYKDKQLDNNFNGAVHDYRKIALEAGRSPWGADNYQSVMPSWDNDARKKGSGVVFQDANPDIYARWLRDVLDRAKPKHATENFVFLNAWNEWAEGTYLEPDKQYGHAFLNRTSEVLADYSRDSGNKEVFPLYSIRRTKDVKLAVIVHLYYADMWPMFKQKFERLPKGTFDLFITIPKKNEDMREELLKFKANTHVMTVPNHGRDVLPFIHFGRRLDEAGYEYVLKLHTKKSPHRVDGDHWMQDLLDKLVPDNEASFKKITDVLDKDSTGLIGPAGHFISLTSFFGSNRNTFSEILRAVVGEKKQEKLIAQLGAYGFFAGTMFWARLDALRPVFDQYYQPADFEVEEGQVDGTFAHALERIFSVVPVIFRKSMYSLEYDKLEKIPQASHSPKTEYDYALNETQSIRNYPGLETPEEVKQQIQPDAPSKAGKVFRVVLNAPSYYASHGPVAANQIIRSFIDDRYHGPKLFPMTLPTATPGVKFIADKLDESKASLAFQDVARVFHHTKKKYPVEFHTFTPATSGGILRLRKAGYRPKIHLDTNISLQFTAGDTVLLNTMKLSEQLRRALFGALNDKDVSQVLWFLPSADFKQFVKDIEEPTFNQLIQSGRILLFSVANDGGISNEAGEKVPVQKIVGLVQFNS